MDEWAGFRPLWVSEDEGESWRRHRPPGPHRPAVRHVIARPGLDGEALAIASRYHGASSSILADSVFRVALGGSDWQLLSERPVSIEAILGEVSRPGTFVPGLLAPRGQGVVEGPAARPSIASTTSSAAEFPDEADEINAVAAGAWISATRNHAARRRAIMKNSFTHASAIFRRDGHMPKLLHSLQTLVTLTLILCISGSARADNRWIADTLSTDLREVLADPVRDRIYAIDFGASDVVILDSKTETVVARIGVPPVLNDLALSKDGQYLAAATSFAIVRIDLDSLEHATFPLPSGYPGYALSLAFDSGGRLIVLGWLSHAYVIDLEASQILQSFGWGQHGFTFPYCHLITDWSGNRLWLVSRSLNPSLVFAFDVRDPRNAVSLGDTFIDHDVGSFMRDVAISPQGDLLYLAPGNPYGVQLFDATNLQVTGLLPGLLGPPAVAVSPAGESVFFAAGTVYGQDRIFQYRASTGELLMEYPLEDRAHNDLTRSRGLAVDRTGRKLFVAHGTSTQFSPSSMMLVVDVGREIEIDIRPGSTKNPIQPSSRGLVEVAVLSSDDFDATSADPASLAFGPHEAEIARRHLTFRDVNGDSRLDLVAGFQTNATGIVCGDEKATLRGVSRGGVPFFGGDRVTTAGCSSSRAPTD